MALVENYSKCSASACFVGEFHYHASLLQSSVKQVVCSLRGLEWRVAPKSVDVVMAPSDKEGMWPYLINIFYFIIFMAPHSWSLTCWDYESSFPPEKQHFWYRMPTTPLWGSIFAYNAGLTEVWSFVLYWFKCVNVTAATPYFWLPYSIAGAEVHTLLLVLKLKQQEPVKM